MRAPTASTAAPSKPSGASGSATRPIEPAGKPTTLFALSRRAKGATDELVEQSGPDVPVPFIVVVCARCDLVQVEAHDLSTACGERHEDVHGLAKGEAARDRCSSVRTKSRV